MPPLSFDFDTNVQVLTKRAACDRCHGQKMRCTSDRRSGKCNRCRAANAYCIYSSPRKPGRPTAKAKRKGAGDTVKRVDIRSSDHVVVQPSTSVNYGDIVQWNRDLCQEAPKLRSHTESKFQCCDYNESSTSNAAEISDVPATISTSTPNRSADMNSSNLGAIQSWHLYQDYAQSADNELDSLEECTGSWNAANHATQIESIFPAALQQQSDRSTERDISTQNVTGFGHYSIPSPPPSVGSSESSMFTTESTINCAREGQNHMQQLSELSGTLFMHEDCRAMPSGLLQGRREVTNLSHLEQQATHVLKSSVSFLNILTSMLQSQSQGRTIAGCELEEAGLMPGHSTTRSRTSADVRSSSSVPYEANPSSPSPMRVPPIDTMATLQLLVSYIRLTEIHHSLYATIHTDLFRPEQPSSSPTTNSGIDSSGFSPSSQKPTLPFSVAGVSLSLRPHFHIQILVQVCMYHLNAIEIALGLPDAFRINASRDPIAYSISNPRGPDRSRRRGGSRNVDDGLLSGSRSAKLLVQTAMMEAQEQHLPKVRLEVARLRKEFTELGCF